MEGTKKTTPFPSGKQVLILLKIQDQEYKGGITVQDANDNDDAKISPRSFEHMQ